MQVLGGNNKALTARESADCTILKDRDTLIEQSVILL